MSDSSKLTFYIDAPEPLGHALQKSLEVLGETPCLMPTGNMAECLGRLDAVIVQYVSKSDFESAQQSYFKVESKHHVFESRHPLKHRFTFDECSEGDAKPKAKDYADRTHPIIYCLDFDFIKYQKEHNNDNIFFLDSSIWQRAVKLNSPSFLNDLRIVIKYFEDNSKYWDRLVTLEALEYQTRMFKEMHLAPFGVVGHATALNLSSWASESKTAPNVGEPQTPQSFLPRRFLLIDDFARQDLRRIGEEESNEKGNPGLSDEVKPAEANVKSISKGQRIYALLGALVDISNCEFDTVQTLAGAKDAVTKKTYDMIFLDYVLDGSAKKRETGLQFLRHLTDDKQNKSIKKSVDEKLWVFPVSSFAEAFIGDMLNGDIQPVNPHFNWSCGADPIRQPNQFKKELCKFLGRQDDRVNLLADGLQVLRLNHAFDEKQDEYGACHKHITLHQEALEALFRLRADSTLIQKKLETVFEGNAPIYFNYISDYLENYLRSRRHYGKTTESACMRDLQCILTLADKKGDPFWQSWARKEMDTFKKELL
jgi:hypothetical protein